MKDINDSIDRNMARLKDEVDALQAWFKKDFPECQMTINVNLDAIKKELQIICTTMTATEMADNRGLFKNMIRIRERDLIDPMFMGAFLKAFNMQYRKEISRVINNHYALEKAKAAELG